MRGANGVAAVSKAGAQALDEVEGEAGVAKQKGTGVGGDVGGVEIDFETASEMGLKPGLSVQSCSCEIRANDPVVSSTQSISSTRSTPSTLSALPTLSG